MCIRFRENETILKYIIYMILLYFWWSWIDIIKMKALYFLLYGGRLYFLTSVAAFTAAVITVIIVIVIDYDQFGFCRPVRQQVVGWICAVIIVVVNTASAVVHTARRHDLLLGQLASMVLFLDQILDVECQIVRRHCVHDTGVVLFVC